MGDMHRCPNCGCMKAMCQLESRQAADALDAQEKRIKELSALLGEAIDFWAVGPNSREDATDYIEFRQRAR